MSSLARLLPDETGQGLVPNEAEQAVVARVRAWRAEGMSLRGIAQRLDDLGISPKRGARWHAKVVASIVGREMRERPRPSGGVSRGRLRNAIQ